MVHFLFSGLIHTEPKNAIFFSDIHPVTNDIHEIDPEKQFILVVYNLSNVSPVAIEHMLLGYAARTLILPILIDAPLVAHITYFLGYVFSDDPKLTDKSPPTPANMRPPDPHEMFLITPTASTLEQVVPPE